MLGAASSAKHNSANLKIKHKFEKTFKPKQNHEKEREREKKVAAETRLLNKWRVLTN